MSVDVPPLVRQRAEAHGNAGQRWLDNLGLVLADLRAKWHLTLGASYAGGTAGLVMRATNANGTPCVLKVAMPLDDEEVHGFAQSVRVHELAEGRGCARLMESSALHSAMLLEQLGPNLAELDMAIPVLLDTIARTAQSFWRPRGIDDHGIPNGSEKAVWLERFITSTWEELNRPCDERVIDEVTGFCAERAAAWSPKDSVLVHGDAHGWNTVRDGSGGFKFVDPEGIWSDRAHELAVPMREYNAPLLEGDTRTLARQRCERLAAICDVDPVAVWQWGAIERVSTGLANLRDFDDSEGIDFLRVAELCHSL